MRGNTCMVILIGARWKMRIEPADLYTHRFDCHFRQCQEIQAAMKRHAFGRSIHDLMGGVILHYMHLRAFSIQMSRAVTRQKMPVNEIGTHQELIG